MSIPLSDKSHGAFNHSFSSEGHQNDKPANDQTRSRYKKLNTAEKSTKLSPVDLNSSVKSALNSSCDEGRGASLADTHNWTHRQPELSVKGCLESSNEPDINSDRQILPNSKLNDELICLERKDQFLSFIDQGLLDKALCLVREGHVDLQGLRDAINNAT